MKPKSKISSFFNSIFVDSRHFGLSDKTESVIKSLKPTERFIFWILTLIFIISGLTLVYKTHKSLLVEVPSFGGNFIEGVVGSPRFINPVLTISDTDKDLSSLIYSGLLKAGEDGTFIPNLASSFSISEDGSVYDFIIKDGAYFHDNKAVTADDVLFTVAKIMDPVVKSPKRTSWEGVTVEKVNEKEVRFILKKPYSPFIEALTLGILPKHIWDNVTSEEFPFSDFNVSPIGSGPYKIDKITKNSGGIPTTINLSPWNRYTLPKPKIANITFKFFQNESELFKAFQDGSIGSVAGITQGMAKKIEKENILVKKSSLPRVFGVFFNQNLAQVFINNEVRDALDVATPKQYIINEVLSGFGKPLNGPTPLNIDDSGEISVDESIASAKAILEKAGWKLNADNIYEKKAKSGTTKLAFSISTTDSPELKRTAEILKETWRKVGASVDVKVFESGDLNQNVIRPRKYDALLFGEVVGESSDLYPFWHSSQRNDPGLNVALYANINADKILESIQKETDQIKKVEERTKLFEIIKKDMPAIFLFSPDFLYVPAQNVKNITLRDVSTQSERFLNINNWYIETDKVWNLFNSNN